MYARIHICMMYACMYMYECMYADTYVCMLYEFVGTELSSHSHNRSNPYLICGYAEEGVVQSKRRDKGIALVMSIPYPWVCRLLLAHLCECLYHHRLDILLQVILTWLSSVYGLCNALRKHKPYLLLCGQEILTTMKAISGAVLTKTSSEGCGCFFPC